MRNVTVMTCYTRFTDGTSESIVVGIFSSIPKAHEAVEEYKARYARRYESARLVPSEFRDNSWRVDLPDGQTHIYSIRKMRVNGALI